jgi:glucosamine-6-phosphate isomerase
MRLFVEDTAALMAARVADELSETLGSIKGPLFCPASGDTPAALYRALRQRVKDQTMNLSDWYFVGLDEWAGMNGQDEGSCRQYVDRDLFEPLGIDEKKICFFDGKAPDLAAECTFTERFIAEHHGIDVVILGIGLNGHFAMNEPGCDPEEYSHVAVLHPSTQTTGQKYFKSHRSLTHGITLGVGTLMAAKHVYLLATGEHKADIMRKALEGPITAEVPASLLRRHPNLHVCLDSAAAKSLTAINLK